MQDKENLILEVKRMEETIKVLKEKANYFFSKNLRVHITKKDKNFFNGEILTTKEDEFVFKINDDKEGERIVFYSEINDIEEYKERGE